MITQSSTQVLSTRRKVLATAATFTMVGGISAAAIAPANAATPVCGPGCISVFSSELDTYPDPNFVEAVLEGGAAEVGQPVGLKPASGSDSSEDFKPGPATNMGSTVSDFYADGLVSEEANSRYGQLTAVQQRYAPLGVDTGLCVGVARVNQGEDLTLQPCADPTTVWIVYPAPADIDPHYFAIVNAATTDFDRPFAMHLPRNEVTTGDPELQMQLRHLQYTTGDKMLPARQIWGADFGPQGT
jgi:hypothetical protein